MTRRAGPETHRRLNSAQVLDLGQQLAAGYGQGLTIRQLAEAQRGAFVCRTHGGAAPQVIAAARRRVEALEAEARELGLDRVEQHELLQHGAARRCLFGGAGLHRVERSERRKAAKTATDPMAAPLSPEPVATSPWEVECRG